MRRWTLVVALLIGLCLVAAPFAFRMFERAPKGAVMLDEFRPFMTEARIGNFKTYMAEIGAADREVDSALRPFLSRSAGIDRREFDRRFESFNRFSTAWPAIQADMGDLLDDVGANIDNYEAIDALPPFGLFPAFFVIPGLLIIAAALVTLVGRPRARGVARWTLVGLGVALVAAPFVFGMFQRTPKGGEMMNDFESMMTRSRVQTMQGYFSTMSVGEGAVRLGIIPALQDDAELDDAQIAERFPAVTALHDDWITIINDMTPMIGAMSDNVDNYEAVRALPPFQLFPWFFVIPGALVAGLALASTLPRSEGSTVTSSRDRKRSAASALTVFVALGLLTVVASGCGDDDDSSTASTTAASPSTTSAEAGELAGTIELVAGACQAADVTGSSMRLVLPSGSVTEGPYFENADSGCSDKTFTILAPGSAGGLLVGDYQSAPDPAFDASGNSLAAAIVEPTPFSGIAFSVSTNATDPQTEDEAPAPTLSVKDGKVTGDMSSVSASWNNEFFNQGSPKPDGSTPGLTAPVSGTYDLETGEIVVEWTSQIEGGPFNDFTGIWHLEGTFQPEG